MSKKPIKFSERKKVKQKEVEESKKKRAIGVPSHTFPLYTMIITEETKTEPNYLLGIAEKINSYYRRFTKHNYIEVEGKGLNTMGLLDYAIDKIVNSDWSKFDTIWLVYCHTANYNRV